MRQFSASDKKFKDKGYFQGFKPVTVETLEELGELMLTHSLCTQIFTKKKIPNPKGKHPVAYRKTTEAVVDTGDVLFFDIDAKGITLKKITKAFKRMGWACVITPSRSSSAEHEKFHIGAFTDAKVPSYKTDKQAYRQMYLNIASQLQLKVDSAMASGIQNLTPALGRKVLKVVKGSVIPWSKVSYSGTDGFGEKPSTVKSGKSGDFETVILKKKKFKAVKGEASGTRCDCPMGDKHSDGAGEGYGFVNDVGGITCNGCGVNYHWKTDKERWSDETSLGGEKVDMSVEGADLPKAELGENLNEEGIKRALLEASKDGAYSLNEMKQEIKEQTGLGLGVLDKMVKEEVASSLDEYFEGHICWDSVRGVFMEVGEKKMREIKKSNFNQTVMSASGWMTPSDVVEVLHGAQNVCGEYRPEIKTRYFQEAGCSGDKLNLYYGVDAKGKGKKIPKLIDKVLDNLFQSDPKAKEYFIHWMAYIVQTGKRTGVAWGFHGAETGTGKGLIVDVLEKMLGRDNCALNVGNDQLAEKFTGYADCKQLIHFNEIAINAQSRHQIAGKMKSIVSDAFIQLRLMGTDAFTVPNYANVILNSNKHNPLELEANDRRWNIINTESKLERLKWWDVGTWDKVIAESLEFKAFLLKMDVDIKKATKIMPKSKAKQNIIEATTSSVEMLAQLVNTGGDVIDFLGVDKKEVMMYDELKWAMKKRRFSNELLIKLYRRVSKNDIADVVEMNRFFKKPYIRGVAEVFDNMNGKSVRGVIYKPEVTV